VDNNSTETIDMNVDYFHVDNVHIVRSPISLTAYYPVDHPPSDETWANALRLIRQLGINENQLAYDECDVSFNGKPALKWAGVTSTGLHNPNDGDAIMPTVGNIPAQVIQAPERMTFSFTVEGVHVEAQRNNHAGAPTPQGLAPRQGYPWQAPDGNGFRNMRMFTLAFPAEDAADEFLPVIDTWLQDMPQIVWIDGTRIRGEQYASLFGTDRIPLTQGLPTFNAQQVRRSIEILKSRGYKSAVQIAMSWDVFVSHDIILEDLQGRIDDYWICAVREGEPTVMANLTTSGNSTEPAPQPAAIPAMRGYRFAQFVFPSKRNAAQYAERLREWAGQQQEHVLLSEVILVDEHGKWQELQGTDPRAENLVTNEHIERAQRSLMTPPEGLEDNYKAAVLVGQHWPEWTYLDNQFVRLGGQIAEYTLVSRADVNQLVEHMGH